MFLLVRSWRGSLRTFVLTINGLFHYAPPPPQKRMHKSKDDRVVICKYAVVIKVVTNLLNVSAIIRAVF